VAPTAFQSPALAPVTNPWVADSIPARSAAVNGWADFPQLAMVKTNNEAINIQRMD
jgi:hypothetical protein